MQYAGISGAELDRGVAYMARAELAGKTFFDTVLETTETEQGRFFTGANSNIVFHNRTRTRYNL